MNSQFWSTAIILTVFVLSPHQVKAIKPGAKSSATTNSSKNKNQMTSQASAPEEACEKPSIAIPKMFVQEFALNPQSVNQVNLKFHPSSEPRLISASHPDLCSPRGCESALFILQKNCAKLAFVYAGKLQPVGSKKFAFHKLSTRIRQIAVDGGQTQQKIYEFNPQNNEYREVSR